MIHADLKGKTHVAEDVLTSNCLGLLCLLPDSSFISFLEAAVTLDGTPINLSLYGRVERIEFWPYLPGGGEPDVIAEVRNKDDSAGMALVIEVKHGAVKASGSPSPEAGGTPPDDLDNPEIVDHDKLRRDQLAKYWRAASKCFPDFALIYLTHHRSLPKDDIATSLHEAGGTAKIFWLSWFHLYRWVIDQVEKTSARTTSERRILETLRNYLSAKGYTCFLGWPSPRFISNCQLVYNHAYFFTTTEGIFNNYIHTYGIGLTTMSLKPQSVRYVHTYGIGRKMIPVGPLCFYRVFQEEP